MDRSKQFREAAARENRGRRKTGWRYSQELKAAAVAIVRNQREAGVAWSQLAEDLDVSPLTLTRWIEAGTPASFRTVEVIEEEVALDEDATELAVVTPGGLRIEGLSWPETLELARIFG